jgi:hypothetical protein
MVVRKRFARSDFSGLGLVPERHNE